MINYYYVSAARGDDATGAGTATNPWKTIAKAVGSSPAASLGADGACVYLEPGTYYEAVTIALTPTATARLELVGDCDGAGFLAGGYATPATGVVDWSSWSNNTTIRNFPCLAGGGKSYVAVRRIKLIGGWNTTSCIDAGTGTDWTISDCTIVPYAAYNAVVFGSTGSPVSAALNLLVERCNFHLTGDSTGRAILLTVAEAAAEYSLASTVRNCRFRGGSVRLQKGTATGLGHLATGLQVSHCSFLGPHSVPVVIYSGETITLAAPTTVSGCYLNGANGLAAGHASHVAEDYNAFHTGGSPRLNVTAGANSVVTVRPAFDYEDGLHAGVPLRPAGTPMPGSSMAAVVPPGSPPADDLTGRPRPAGFGSLNASIGALERHDVSADDATYADGGAGFCLKITGPGDVEVPVLVLSRPTTISVKVRWDGNHGDANKPRAMLLAEPELGAAAQTLTATSTGGAGATPNAYETLTFSSFTPSRAGAVVLRLLGRPAAASGVAYFDSISVAVV